jgi:hypothetical protein
VPSFSWFSGGKSEPCLPESQAREVERAAADLGVVHVRWKKDAAEFAYRDQKRTLPGLTLRSIMPESVTGTRAVLILLALAELLEITPPSDLLRDFAALRPLLRPRLLHPRELSGPRRAMCRREAFGGLLQALAIGPSHAAPLVTSPVLDGWPVTFDEASEIARTNLHAAIADRDLHEIAGTPGVLAFVSDHEQAASAAFLIERFTSDAPKVATRGMVFTVPHEELLLLLPVVPNAGAEPLASLVHTTFQTSTAAEDPLSESLFWYRKGTILELPMTTVTEGKGRRVHLEAKGPLEELLRILGALD